MTLITKAKIIGWWSGGVTSSVACKLAINLFGKENVRIVMIDTHNESSDTYRFKNDCEKWYGLKIEVISAIPDKYNSIQDVWRKHNSLNVAHGAICSSELKRDVRRMFQKENDYQYQVFGFDIDEPRRAKAMTLNYPDAKAIYPLLMHGLSKKMCISMIKSNGIQIPESYSDGYTNNNCMQTGCVQGGIGYWKKIQNDYPYKFSAMAAMERELSKKKGSPVTCCKDQSKSAKKSGVFHVFLEPNPDFPFHKYLDDMSGREPENLLECNGFGCAINDLV